MLITHIYKDYHQVLSGIENTIKRLAEAQAAAGHEVRVIVAHRGNETSDDIENSVHVIRCAQKKTLLSTPLAPGMLTAIARHTRGADIAHVHSPCPPGEFFNLLFGRATRTVLSWHSDVVKQKTLLCVCGSTLRRVIRHAHVIVPCTRKYAKTSIWHQPHLKEVHPFAYGIDLARVGHSAAQAFENRNRLGLGDAFTTVSTGCFRHHEGFGDLIGALPAAPGVHTLLNGDRPLRNKWPASASGLPTITTEVGNGTSMVNQHGCTGLVVAPNAPAELAAAICQLQAAPAERQALANNAQARAASECSIPHMLANNQAVDDEVLGR